MKRISLIKLIKLAVEQGLKVRVERNRTIIDGKHGVSIIISQDGSMMRGDVRLDLANKMSGIAAARALKLV